MTAEDQGKESPKNTWINSFQTWIGICGVVVSSVVALWATQIDHKTSNFTGELQKLEKAQDDQRIEIENQKFFLQQKKEDIARYEYVRGLYDELISTNKQKQRFTINLVQLVLTDDEYNSLFNGFASSSDQTEKELGETALNLKEETELRERVQRINSPEQSIRLAATDILKNKYAGNARVIDLVLDFFDSDKIDILSAQGRLNALFYLKNTTLKAWTPDLIQRADGVIQRLEERHQNGKAPIGAQTRQNLEDFKVHLSKVKAEVGS